MKAREVIKDVERESHLSKTQVREVANWFHEREGELFPREYAIEKISDELELEVPNHLTKESFINELIGDLVSDHVDPVQLIQSTNVKYVGIIDYNEHSTYYTYNEYHDIEGEYKRGVCAACIHESTKSSEPFTRHTGNFGKPPHGDEEQLAEEIAIHVEAVHSVEDVEVKTGATLASGTTISGNISIHVGNDGSGSGLSADDVDGSEPPFSNTDLSNDSITVAGNGVSLGESTTVDYVELNDTGTSFPIPNSDLNNSDITINGTAVSLGSSISVSGYTDSDAISAVNNDSDHGSTASHNYTTSASSLSDYPFGTGDLSFDPATQSELDAYSPPIFGQKGTENFDGSNGESISQSGTLVSNNQIQLLQSDSSVSMGSEDNQDEFAERRRGVKVTINSDNVKKFEITSWFPYTGSISTMYVYDSNNNQVKSTSASQSNASIRYDFQKGNTYYIGVNNNGSYFHAGQNRNPSYNYNSEHFDAITGSYDIGDANGDNDVVYVFNGLKAYQEENSGTAYVDFQTDASSIVDSWDKMACSVNSDGETATVDIQEYDGSWTTIQSGITNGENISASSNNRIRFKLNLSRSNSSNNPRIESLHERYVLY